MLYHTMNVTSTEAKLFIISCSINQAINTDNISKINCYELKSLELNNRTTFILSNSIEIPLQTSLPFILLLMVCAHYCTPYPKWPCVEHEVNMWYPCCITSLVLEPSTLFSQVLWLMLWLITSAPNPSCPKNRKIRKENKNKIKIKNKIERN